MGQAPASRDSGASPAAPDHTARKEQAGPQRPLFFLDILLLLTLSPTPFRMGRPLRSSMFDL